MKLIIFVSLCLIGVCVGALPAIEFDACDARDPNFDDCVRASLETFFGKLNGSGPFTEPLRAAQLILGPGDKLFNARLELYNVETYGWSQTKFQIATSISLEKRNATLRGIAPSLRITAPYRASGSILDSSLNREGILTAVLENVVWEWRGNLETFERDGEKYWRRISSEVSLIPERVRLDLSNQSSSLIRDIDENWRYLFVELRRDYENILNAVLGRFADTLYEQAPIKTFILNFEEYSLK